MASAIMTPLPQQLRYKQALQLAANVEHNSSSTNYEEYGQALLELAPPQASSSYMTQEVTMSALPQNQQ